MDTEKSIYIKKKKKGYETLKKRKKIRKRVLEQCRGIQEEIHQYERWVKERVFNTGEITRVGGKARSKSIDLRCSDATRDYHLLISAVGETVIITPESRIRSQGGKNVIREVFNLLFPGCERRISKNTAISIRKFTTEDYLILETSSLSR